jgi:hypothetical protein
VALGRLRRGGGWRLACGGGARLEDAAPARDDSLRKEMSPWAGWAGMPGYMWWFWWNTPSRTGGETLNGANAEVDYWAGQSSLGRSAARPQKRKKKNC